MTYIPSNARIIKRVPKTAQTPFSYIVVDSIPTNETVIVVFGGELSTSDRAANSSAKQIQNLLHENEIYDVNVYAVVYDFGSRNAKLERTDQFRMAGRRLAKASLTDEQTSLLSEMRKNEPLPNYIKQLFDILILPRIRDKQGKRLPVEQAVRFIRKLRFYANCHGASSIWQMANYMYATLISLGYTKEEANKIQSEVLVIQHSPTAPLTKQKFTTLSFASAEDTMMQDHSNLFAKWLYENSADIVPCFFDKPAGNLFVAGHLQEQPFKEHLNSGLTEGERKISPLTSDGNVILNAERNAIIRAVKKSQQDQTINSVKELTDGDGVDFDELKENGERLYKIMLRDLRQQNLKHDYQK